MSPIGCRLVLLLAAFAVPAGGQSPRGDAPATRAALHAGALVVTNVSMVPMTSERVIADAALVVRNGRIEWIGPRGELKVPASAQVMDGRGGYLLPGLADMHTHLFSDGDEVADSAGPSELAVMLANGVTVARLMIGTPEQLVLRRDVTAGRVAGPQLWVASPQFTGRPSENALVVTTAEQARAAVRTVAAEGYDFVKLTLHISSAVYEAVIDEAKQRGIRVVGHVEPEIGVERALAAGQQLEHLDAYLEAVLADSSPTKRSLTQGGVFAMANWRSLDYVDDRKIARIAGATARAGVFVGPTQNVFNTAFAIGESDAVIRARPDYPLWPAKLRDGYHRAHARYWAPANDTIRTAARRQKYVDIRNRLVKAIQDSGGKILAGSDTPEWFHAYGFGLHRELQALVAAGLTPYQAIVSATRAPAEYLGATADWGTLEVGKRADFILLSGNPLADVRNTERIEAVGAGGMWHNRAQLDTMISRAQLVITAGGPSTVR